MIPYFSPSFLALFDEDSTPLSSVMNYPQLSAASRADAGLVNHYLSHHIQEILDIVLTDNTEPYVSTFINILSFSVSDIFRAVLRGSRFSDMAAEILSDQKSSEKVISRLATITLSLLINVPEEATKQCGFIYHLLKRININTVYDLFNTILADDERCLPARTWLHLFAFPEFILRELENIDYEGFESQEVVPYYDKTYSITSALYVLIAKTTKTDTLKDDFLSPKAAKILKKSFTHRPPNYVLNSRWKAIRCIVCEKNLEEFRPLFDEAITILSEETKKLAEYHVNAIYFIISMIKLDQSLAQKAVDSKLPNWILGLVLQFQNSSILHTAFRSFVTDLIDIKPLGQNIIDIYTPMLAESARVKSNKVLRPTIFALIETIRDAATRNPEYAESLRIIVEFGEICATEVPEYRTQSTMPYGGKMKSSLSDFFANFL
ncbi:hypothetical protein TRFO_11564 [Tritrichomonas foetus]|uniref:Uncharacterized protein n=1 Tax=Tritrichomonas foetus TaxID=1144522 RepID=A0A1J4J2T8_9EUKA|nr:hypothetical protein TRFO_11564 [Tritrichomonas foetus]|eukprot:OHS93768.1 hypothetical protein TRFO_11564 [Tritrichomonas foetus]